MSTMSKLSYLKRYMSKEDLQDFKMKNKVKKKVLSDLEKRKTEGDQSQSVSAGGLKKSEVSRKPSAQIKKKIRHDTDSDSSPPRKSISNLSRKSRHDSDSDQSPPRKSSAVLPKKTRHDSDTSQTPPRKSYKIASDSDQSPPRKSSKMASDPDQSKPRKSSKMAFNPDQSPPRKSPKMASDSDQSPPRKSPKMALDSDQSPPRKSSKIASDSDQSPPRKSSKMASDSDQSPPRKPSSAPIRRKRHDSDSDQSPPRRRKLSPPSSTSSKRGDRPSRFSNLSPPPSSKTSIGTKATKTMSGATAGLSSAAEMRREAKVLRDKEDQSFQKIDEDILGKNAKTVMRDRETGKRRNMQAEKEQEDKKEKKLEEQKAKYQQWGQGMSQQEEREKRLADQVHEASKPLARYKDDHDLDDMLRKETRAEDPMLAFIQRKKDKEEAKGGKVKAKKELPKYRGPTAPPPNRYNILPGYRWDGVDRSNGFEGKIFANINNKKAIKEIAYKWSTEDM